MTMTDPPRTEGANGRVVAIAGPVIDVEFPRGALPEINTELEMTIDVGGNDVDLAKLRLTVEDLERFGPTLILDQKDSDGARVLIWSQ